VISEEQIKTIMTTYLNLSLENLTGDKVLTELVAESFVLIEMLMAMQDKLGIIINQEDIQDVSTVGDLVNVFLEKDSA